MVVTLEDILRRHREATHLFGVAYEQSTADIREENVGAHASIDDLGHVVGAVSQKTETLAKVIEVLVWNFATGIGVRVSGQSSKFEINESQAR